MDLSYWTALRPDIKVVHTNRLMYSEYICRLEVRAPGCSILRDLDKDIDKAAAERNGLMRFANFGGSWRRNKSDALTSADTDLLKHIKKNLLNLTGMKIRIEEPSMQFYAKGENDLKSLAHHLRWDDNKHFTNVMLPENEAGKQLIQDGYVLRKMAAEWPYRIVMRDGRYSDQTKQQLKTYLEQLGPDLVKVPESLWGHLDKGVWIWSGYVYVKDPDLASMFTMINPNLVAKIEEFRTPG